MNIVVGSTNPVKVAAVQELIADYKQLAGSTVTSVEVPSLVADQPLSIEETIRGAINRAQGALDDHDLSFGIESGLMQVPHTATGYLTVCACAIYTGKEFFIGLSSAFESPAQITHLMVNEGLDMNQAFNKLGVTKNPKLGSSQGAVGILTNGRVDRVAYSKQAIIMALVKLENRELFERLS